MTQKNFDLIIIGGGALGTFHAYHALSEGLSVAIIEKNNHPQGATVRNFGQVVPSGMNLKWQNYGRKSLEIYKTIQAKTDISIRQNGTIYIASNDEELQLIEELAKINKANSYESQMLTKQQCLKKYSGLKNDYCKAGLFFPDEITVEPRTMIHQVRNYLIKEFDLTYFSNELVIDITEVNSKVEITTASNQVRTASKVFVCNGSDFKALFPDLFNKSDLEVSKLQMLKTKPQPKHYQLNGSILTGWTIRRYEAFTECPSYQEIKAKEDQNSFQKKFGIHILFKQALDGSVILGDSHEYADAEKADTLSFDNNEDIDQFMITEAKKIINLPTYTIESRWSGFYSQCKTQDIFNETIGNNIHIITGIGGKGMTGSAGYALQNIQNLF